MVKGISRQVIVVRPTQNDLFDQAIFILRDREVTDAQLIRQANQAAERYVHNSMQEDRLHQRWFQPFLYTGLGAAATGLFWVLTAFL